MLRIICIALLALTGCRADQTVSAQTVPSDVWRLVMMDGKGVSAPITLEFPEEGRITGRAPCNRYFAQQTAPLPWFKVDAIGATRMACEQMDLESEYFDALSRATLAEIQGDTLLLGTENGTILRYRRAK